MGPLLLTVLAQELFPSQPLVLRVDSHSMVRIWVQEGNTSLPILLLQHLGDISFAFGTGGNNFTDVSSIQTVSAFSMVGTNLTTGNVAVAAISATTSVNIDLGGMSGSAVITAIDTDGSFTLNAGSAAESLM